MLTSRQFSRHVANLAVLYEWVTIRRYSTVQYISCFRFMIRSAIFDSMCGKFVNPHITTLRRFVVEYPTVSALCSQVALCSNNACVSMQLYCDCHHSDQHSPVHVQDSKLLLQYSTQKCAAHAVRNCNCANRTILMLCNNARLNPRVICLPIQ